jgi:NAD(P)H-hydrate repair Nnr-like enzyme with NAD(P)H-hydrate dehydratase domain
MAAILGCAPERVARDPASTARYAAARFGATLVLKAGETLVAGPDGTLLHYPGGGVGLATGGSGDVLAGILGGLLARGADPLVAAGWAVWAHGEAGRRLAADMAPIGFIASDLLPLVPGLLHLRG